MADSKLFTADDARDCGLKHIIPMLKGKANFSVNDAIAAELKLQKEADMKKARNAQKFAANFPRKMAIKKSASRNASRNRSRSRSASPSRLDEVMTRSKMKNTRSVGALVPLVPKRQRSLALVPVTKKKPPSKALNPAKIAKALQAKLKAKITAQQKKQKAAFAKEQKALKAKLRKQKENEKKRVQQQKEAERKAKAKSAAAEKKFTKKMAAVAKREKEAERKANQKLKAQELQAKVQAKYWQDVQKQAQQAQAKRAQRSGKKGHKGIPPAILDELQFLRQQVAMGQAMGLGGRKGKKPMFALGF